MLAAFVLTAIVSVSGSVTLIEQNVGNLEKLLTETLTNSDRGSKCTVVMFDEVYGDLLSSALFNELSKSSSCMTIRVRENEDLLSPNSETKRGLEVAKHAGCKTFAILVSNGVQVSRLLRFGDRYRMLDAGANYVMLHDSRLFAASVHYLWRRLVNVVFLKEHSSEDGSWFDVSTVPYPSPIIGSFLVPRRVDVWSKKGRFKIGEPLFFDKTADLKNETLRVAVFEHVPSTVVRPGAFLETGSGRAYTGIEAEMIRTLSNAMNFTAAAYEPPDADVEKWGRRRRGNGGEYTGLIGELVHRRSDLAIGDLQHTLYYLDLMDLSIPYNTECWTFLTPESTTNTSWMTLILPFRIYMWMSIIVVFFCLVVIFYCLANIHGHLYLEYHGPPPTEKPIPVPPTYNKFLRKQRKKKKKDEEEEEEEEERCWFEDDAHPKGLHLFDSLSNTFLYTYGMMLLVSLPRIPSGWALRLLAGWYFLYCVCVVVSYRASMVAVLAYHRPRVTIDNLAELDKSKLPRGGWSESAEQFSSVFATAIPFEKVNDTDASVDRVAAGAFAFYENVYYLKDAVVKRKKKKKRYVKDDDEEEEMERGKTGGERNLHVMKSCVINVPVSIGLQKNSPLKRRIDRYVTRFVEGGLVAKWLADVTESISRSKIGETDGKSGKSRALMDLRKMFGALAVLCIGYTSSAIVLAFEFLYWWATVKNHPKYDKYSRRILTSAE